MLMMSSWTWKEIGDGEEEHHINPGSCRRRRERVGKGAWGRPQTDPVQTLALPLRTGAWQGFSRASCEWGSHTQLLGLLWGLIKVPPGHVLVDSEHVIHTDGAEEEREALQAPVFPRLGRHQLPTLLRSLLPPARPQASRHFDLRTCLRPFGISASRRHAPVSPVPAQAWLL